MSKIVSTHPGGRQVTKLHIFTKVTAGVTLGEYSIICLISRGRLQYQPTTGRCNIQSYKSSATISISSAYEDRFLSELKNIFSFLICIYVLYLKSRLFYFLHGPLLNKEIPLRNSLLKRQASDCVNENEKNIACLKTLVTSHDSRDTKYFDKD